MIPRAHYWDLDPAEKQAIHGWLTDHGIDYTRVPVEAPWEFDPAVGEWRIELFWHDARDRVTLLPDRSDVRRVMVRRRELRPLPWLAAARRVHHTEEPAPDAR